MLNSIFVWPAALPYRTLGPLPSSLRFSLSFKILCCPVENFNAGVIQPKCLT